MMSKKKLTKTDILKNNLINALENSLGVVTTACKSAGCSRDTFYKYVREDENFKDRVNDIQNIALDFAESKLYEQIKDNNITAIIFYLKTKGKTRGYVERTEVVTTEIKPIEYIDATNNENTSTTASD